MNLFWWNAWVVVGVLVLVAIGIALGRLIRRGRDDGSDRR